MIRPPGRKKLVPTRAVEQQQHAGGEQHGETEQAEDRGDEPGPAGERHAHQRHALAAQVDQWSR